MIGGGKKKKLSPLLKEYIFNLPIRLHLISFRDLLTLLAPPVYYIAKSFDNVGISSSDGNRSENRNESARWVHLISDWMN